ncbi:Lipoyltransferase 1, mitochondrial [Aphelenchoides fujianensis]|nr:Lipoyltransferase 1, mitochondrial [Aphelenchoides fujianensis]
MSRIARLRIFNSRSTCIFRNLAFEEWLFRRHDLNRWEEAVLMWSNTPTVVIGRHQNAWLEADVRFVRERGIQLVRRYSGGGTVYHDLGKPTGHLIILPLLRLLGNLNVAILTTHKRHHRPRNLANIAGWLNDRFGLKIELNKRDDLLLQPGDRKISGTAARIARGRAYHHLTLLVNPDMPALRRSLQSPFHSLIETNATRSVRAKAVGQLVDEQPALNVQALIPALIDGFKRLAEEVEFLDVDDVIRSMDEEDARKVEETERELRSDEWTFGKSPKFRLLLPDPRGQLQPVDVEQGVIVESTNELYEVGSTFRPIN